MKATRVPVHKDAFGLALMDHLQGGSSVEIIERDDGLVESITMEDSLYFAEFDEWPGHEQKAMRYVEGRVLDVGCGAGRVALWLQDQGHDVVGIDVSPLAIKVSRERGVKRARVMDLKEVDLGLGTFDTVVMLGNNLGLLGSPSGARARLKDLAKIVPPGGRLIGSTLDPYETDAPEHLAYHRANHAKGRWGGEVRMRVRYKTAATDWFRYSFFSEDEVARLVEPTPWAIERFIRSAQHGYAAILQRT